MTRQQYLEEAELEIIGLTQMEAKEKGYLTVVERPETISVRIKVLVEMDGKKIKDVLEVI